MPTAKRQAYLDRQLAKQANQRTEVERRTEIDKAMAKLMELGISDEFEEIKRFTVLANDWVIKGGAVQGIIPIIGLKRELVYSLTNNKKQDVGIMLRAVAPHGT
jgi:hypothetical protein